MQSSEKIMLQLDKWLIDKGETRYQEDDKNATEAYENFYLNPLPAIQQNRNEIENFIKILLNKKEKKICLEVGLGHYGSTHFIWRQIFDKTITIEADWSRVKDFGLNMTNFHGKYVLGDKKSHFIHGFSYNPKSLLSLKEILKNEKLDFLFIDGDHKYESIMADYLLYKNFVQEGGIIGFHDYLLPMHNFGVQRFLNDLSHGKIDNNKHNINKIISSKEIGIAWIRL